MVAEEDESDRKAILARRQRFVALALGSLTTASCTPRPQVCLRTTEVHEPEPETEGETEGDASAPFVEDPGAPVEPSEPEPDSGETSGSDEPPPQPCLKVAPKPCLEKRPPPQPCLLLMND